MNRFTTHPKTLYNHNPVTAKLAESCWFVSSFVLSLLLGPFSALPALIALFSIKCDSVLPMNTIH